MEHISPDMLEIILRHLRNEASLPEEKRLSDWLAQDPQHRTDLDEVRRLWEMTAPESSFEPNVEAAWEKVKARTTGFEMPTQTARVFRLPEFFWSAAASVALLVGFGTLIYQSTNPTAESWTQVASEGEVKKIWMPDSSLVWLNRNSSVSYSDFTGNRRLVKLQGEAFFEVRKNPEKPFQIEGRESVTEVLGTSFTITSEPGKPDQIEVVTGKVSFTARASEASKVTLTPGQKAVVQSNATIQTTQVEDPNGRSWQTGRLSFDNMPLPLVLERLERHFGVNFDLADAKKSTCRFTGTFEKPEMDEVLKVLSLSVGLEVQQKAGVYHIKGGQCP